MACREQRYILAIAKYKSIKKAAESLHITSPTLSIFLSATERTLGTKLFDRIGKTFKPTQVGLLYIETARKMMELEAEYETHLNNYLHHISGKVSFGIHLRRTPFLLPPVIKEFLTYYPTINLFPHELDSKSAYNQLLNGDLDFIVANIKINNPSLVYEPLYLEQMVIVISPENPICRKISLGIDGKPYINIKELKDECFILQLPEQSIRMYSDKIISESGITPKKIIVISNLETAYQMAAENIGISFNYKHFVQNFTYFKAPLFFYIQNAPNIPYYIVYRNDKFMSSYTRKLIDLIKNKAQNMK